MLAAYIDASPHEWPKNMEDIALLCHGYLDLQAALAEAREAFGHSESERCELRAALRDTIEALGGVAAPGVSVQFLKLAPQEAAAVKKQLAEEKERWIQEREAWIAQKAECVTLREKLAEAEADSKRLDWLHARMAHVFEWTTGRFGVESRSGRDHWLVRPIYNTPRAAIDAARKGKP